MSGPRLTFGSCIYSWILFLLKMLIFCSLWVVCIDFGSLKLYGSIIHLNCGIFYTLVPLKFCVKSKCLIPTLYSLLRELGSPRGTPIWSRKKKKKSGTVAECTCYSIYKPGGLINKHQGSASLPLCI